MSNFIDICRLNTLNDIPAAVDIIHVISIGVYMYSLMFYWNVIDYEYVPLPFRFVPFGVCEYKYTLAAERIWGLLNNGNTNAPLFLLNFIFAIYDFPGVYWSITPHIKLYCLRATSYT